MIRIDSFSWKPVETTTRVEEEELSVDCQKIKCVIGPYLILSKPNNTDRQMSEWNPLK